MSPWIEWPLSIASWAVSIWFFWNLSNFKWSACKCGREKLPYFARWHEKGWVMLGQAGFCFGWAVLTTFTGHMWLPFFMGAIGLYDIKRWREHDKGKKSVLGKILGWIGFNDHGRLVVKQATI